jgi:hypothetical protein
MPIIRTKEVEAPQSGMAESNLGSCKMGARSAEQGQEMTDDELEQIKHHFGVVAESLESKIQLVAEGHGLLRDEIRSFREETRESLGDLRSMIRLSYTEIDQRFARLEGELEAVKDRLARLESQATA